MTQMTPSNKNEIMAFWESDAQEVELPTATLTKEIEPGGARQIIACELGFLARESQASEDILDKICKRYNGEWYYRTGASDAYYIYFTDPDDAIWFVNYAAWDVFNGYIEEHTNDI